MDREYIGENCVRPDGFTFRGGVTTVVDAGSSGWPNFGEFRDQIMFHVRASTHPAANDVQHCEERGSWSG